jgi:glucokinase
VRAVAQRLIGVDVGGTKISVAVLDDGRLSEPVLQATRTDGAEALVDQLVVAAHAAGPADAVGFGVPSVIDFETGTARSSVNIPLHGVPLRMLMAERLGIPAFVDNDATVAALAEAFDDDLRPIAQTLVMLTIGTGVGGGIVIGGRIHRGATGAAAELGHLIIAADVEHGAPAPAAHPPQPSSLEHHAAGRALDHLGQARGIGDGRAVVDAAHAGNADAIDCVRIVGERLGIGIANMVNTFDPDLVVIGGGVSRAGELLLGPARRVAQGFILEGVGTQTEIRLARYGPQAGVRGAALLARQELEHHNDRKAG